MDPNRDHLAMQIAWSWHPIPRRFARVDGRVRAVVNEVEARDIFAQQTPQATPAAIEYGIRVFQARLDELVNDRPGVVESLLERRY